MRDVLSGAAEADWLACAQSLLLRRDLATCEALLTSALAEHPAACEIRMALAGVLLQLGEKPRAESLLRTLLNDNPDHAAASFLLARLLRQQGRMAAAASVLRALFGRQQRHDTELVIQAVELLDDCARQEDAAALCENEIARGSTDARLYAYAGMLLSQLGQFDLARARYQFVIANSSQAPEWQSVQGLAELQRYRDDGHADFALFRQQLQRTDLSEPARASLLFALGKAHDDVGQYDTAAGYFRAANSLAHAGVRWSRKLWQRSVEMRMSRRLPAEPLVPTLDWTPVFIVGMPRSGTTLLAQLLARHPEVCHRGELTWLPMLAEQLALARGDYRTHLQRAAMAYAEQLRQDDSTAHWFIDKQPHNFMHVDLILSMFPNARILYCRRHARDNALSLWMQSFQPGTQDFSYDFADIAATIQGSRRLMAHWLKRYPASILEVRYEDLTADPARCLRTLSAWLELPAYDPLGARDGTAPISTASLWQARQPIHTRSVDRWRHYAGCLPELLRMPID